MTKKIYALWKNLTTAITWNVWNESKVIPEPFEKVKN